jgi:addiction module HigA family antidote
MIQPPHPGETIKEDYLLPLGMSVNALAKQLGIGTARLNEIVRGERGISADTALRLARYFDTSAESWLGLQLEYDLRIAQQKAGKLIARQVKTRKQAA